MKLLHLFRAWLAPDMYDAQAAMSRKLSEITHAAAMYKRSALRVDIRRMDYWVKRHTQCCNDWQEMASDYMARFL